MPIYEIWQNADGTELSLFQADARALSPRWYCDSDGEPMWLLASYWARGWEEAKKARDAILGWGG